MYPCEWKINEDPENEAGTAKFIIEGSEYVLGLECFADCLRINRMLEAALEQGKHFGAETIRDRIRGLMSQIDS